MLYKQNELRTHNMGHNTHDNDYFIKNYKQ